MSFSYTHGYPYKSPLAIPHLDRRLKGLDILIYRVLKRLTDSAQVRTVLDASKYKEECRERHGYTSNSDSSSINSNGDGLVTKSY